MNLTNKLFSLLGFAEPVALERSNGINELPESTLFIGTSDHLNVDIQKALEQLKVNIIDSYDGITEKSIKALVIDGTNYIDESNYQNLYSSVKNSLKYMANNAKIIVCANTTSIQQSVEKNAFSQAIIGFSKSLAKEVGRKGSTANVLLINQNDNKTIENISKALMSPIAFLLSSKSAFVSGQALTINCQYKVKVKTSKASNKQKVAVVTGAAQGIGASIASKLTKEGYLVIGVDIEPMKEQLKETMEKLQGKSFILDVSATNAPEQLSVLASTHDGFDLVVHNAGITRDKTLAKMPEHLWDQTLDINLFSVMRINKTLINKESINKGGSIVCLSSMNGIAGQGGQTNYACSKAGIIGYVKSMSEKLADRNITINAVAPGFIETQMTDSIPFFTREMGRRMSALGQGGLPVDVAESVAFLGNEANYTISGQTLRICGLNFIGT